MHAAALVLAVVRRPDCVRSFPMPRPRMDAARISGVLAGVRYPARTWQLLAQADAYGADALTRAVLGRLPDGTFASLDAVLAVLGDGPPTRSLPGRRAGVS